MKSLRTCFAHIAAINAFAVAQPVFDRLSSNPEYLRLEGYSKIAIAASLLIYLFAVPVVTTAVVAALRRLHCPKAADRVFAAFGVILMAFMINVAMRWVQWRFSLRAAGITDSVFTVLSLLTATGSAWLYRRFEWPRQLLSIATLGVILFPLNLLSTPAMRAELLGHTPTVQSDIRVENPVPIVFVAFDGLCAMSLLNEQHEIDAVRYPSFARIAKTSRFYRNATSVHCRTTQAMPAILTGQLPSADKLEPVESLHPQNLFRLIYESGEYDMTVFEPLTRLCPTELLTLEKNQTVFEQIAELTSILGMVYIATSVPNDIEFLQFQIPRVWFGFVPNAAGKPLPAKGLISYGWDTGHQIQVDHFTRSLVKADKPGFHFLHIVIPHDPWSHLPSGKEYIRSCNISEPTVGAFGALGELWGDDELMVQYGWQRYLLQLQYADRCLGQIIDQLESTGEFDRSLMIVIADHGMAFVPGQERRNPTNSTVADLMSVPLFIKMPGQNTGKISDINVETIDVLPTIADTIGMSLPQTIDGESLLAADQHIRPRKTMYFNDNQITIADPDFPERFRYVDRMLEVFGSGDHNDRLWSLNTIPKLVGAGLEDCNIGIRSEWQCTLFRGGKEPVSDDSTPGSPQFVPCYFSGSLIGPKITTPVQIAISLNGRIECTTRTSQNQTKNQQWTALVRDNLFHSEGNEVQFFEVEESNGAYILHEFSP